MARFEGVNALDNVREGVLNQVVRVACAARRSRKASVRPALQARQVASHQIVEVCLVARPGAQHQNEGSLCLGGSAVLRPRSAVVHSNKLPGCQAECAYHTLPRRDCERRRRPARLLYPSLVSCTRQRRERRRKANSTRKLALESAHTTLFALFATHGEYHTAKRSAMSPLSNVTLVRECPINWPSTLAVTCSSRW